MLQYRIASQSTSTVAVPRCFSSRYPSSQSVFLGMKRKADSNKETPVKRPKVEDYCSIQSRRDSRGDIIWPAPKEQIRAARAFIKEW